MALSLQNFPGGSKSRVTKAGEAVRNGNIDILDLITIERWRAAHRHVLNTFQAILRNRTRGHDIIVAQRHKRKVTIYDKLRRLPEMALARMDDVAGCRMIFPDIASLYKFRTNLHKARFQHKRKNADDKYDYIKSPKSTGYRGIHDVYEYNVNSIHGSDYKGLLIEIQYRTIYQHAWATCVEVIGHITTNQPKFQEGDARYGLIMSYASEIIARSFEDSTSCHPEFDDKTIVSEFLKLDADLGLLQILRGLNAADKEVTDRKNVILIFSDTSDLEVRTYRDSTEAINALFVLEKENPGKDIVLVRADKSDDVRIAFRNYFSDAREFIRLIESGCAKLASQTKAH